VSVKTLALQTLQREYDALLQKLERQRVRSQALEKKFEVSDVELNRLIDEKEQLTGQVQMLEAQVEELQQARDEARKMGTESASQYMKIVEMADRLQGKGVEDKRNWEREKEVLLGRIRALEDSHTNIRDEGTGSSVAEPGIQMLLGHAEEVAKAESSAVVDATARLRREVHSLRERIKTLETALQTARDEVQAVREAALVLTGCGQRIDSAVNAVLGKDR